MKSQGTLLHCEEAIRFIDHISDPVTKNFVNMAFVRFVQESNLKKTIRPSCDFDMLYFVRVLTDFFSEHDVIAQTLAGEKVGAWFEDEG